MKRMSIVALLALVLTACGQEEAPTAAQPGVSVTEGAQTPSGAAGESAGNKAPENVTDELPTQKQLDPAADKSKSAE